MSPVKFQLLVSLVCVSILSSSSVPCTSSLFFSEVLRHILLCVFENVYSSMHWAFGHHESHDKTSKMASQELTFQLITQISKMRSSRTWNCSTLILLWTLWEILLNEIDALSEIVFWQMKANHPKIVKKWSHNYATSWRSDPWSNLRVLLFLRRYLSILYLNAQATKTLPFCLHVWSFPRGWCNQWRKDELITTDVWRCIRM